MQCLYFRFGQLTLQQNSKLTQQNLTETEAAMQEERRPVSALVQLGLTDFLTKAVPGLDYNPTNQTNLSILVQLLFEYLSYLGTPALPFADRVIEYQRSSCKDGKSWHFTEIKW